MKNWNEYFTKSSNENINEEHHMVTKEDRIAWICDVLDTLSEEDIEKIYFFVEDVIGTE